MRLRTKFILFVAILHLLALVLSFLIFDEKIYFIISEIFIIISIIISWNFYHQLIAPLNRLMLGIESIRDRDFNVKFIKTGAGEMDALVEVYNTMIDELRKERTLQQEQHFFLEKLIATSPTGIIILDFDGNIQSINQKAADFLQLSQQAILRRPVIAINHPLAERLQSLAHGESATMQLTGIDTFKVHKAHFIDRGFSRTFIMIERLTEEILAAEKKVYGKVIRMMAHEVNNSIGPVNSIIRSVLNTNQGLDRHFEEALEVAVNRNENLNLFTRNLADLVKLPEPAKSNVDLIPLLYSVARLMEIKAGEKDIKFTFDLDQAIFFIRADKAQMEQVFINIVKNAIEAIDSKGEIGFFLHGRRLTISDTGRGIDREDEPHVFSPFFSTKKEGQGIGLTLVREVLNNHGLRFSLATNPATWRTDFVIDLV